MNLTSNEVEYRCSVPGRGLHRAKIVMFSARLFAVAKVPADPCTTDTGVS